MKNAIRYRQMFESYGGIMRTKQLTDEKVFYATIQQLLHEGYIEKIKIGCYRWAENQNTDEAQLISQLFQMEFCVWKRHCIIIDILKKSLKSGISQ